MYCLDLGYILYFGFDNLVWNLLLGVEYKGLNMLLLGVFFFLFLIVIVYNIVIFVGGVGLEVF